MKTRTNIRLVLLLKTRTCLHALKDDTLRTALGTMKRCIHIYVSQKLTLRIIYFTGAKCSTPFFLFFAIVQGFLLNTLIILSQLNCPQDKTACILYFKVFSLIFFVVYNAGIVLESAYAIGFHPKKGVLVSLFVFVWVLLFLFRFVFSLFCFILCVFFLFYTKR